MIPLHTNALKCDVQHTKNNISKKFRRIVIVCRKVYDSDLLQKLYMSKEILFSRDF